MTRADDRRGGVFRARHFIEASVLRSGAFFRRVPISFAAFVEPFIDGAYSRDMYAPPTGHTTQIRILVWSVNQSALHIFENLISISWARRPGRSAPRGPHGSCALRCLTGGRRACGRSPYSSRRLLVRCHRHTPEKRPYGKVSPVAARSARSRSTRLQYRRDLAPNIEKTSTWSGA